MARSIKDIANRLEMTRGALDVSAAELCRLSGITPTQWTQFTDPKYKRRVTLNAAYKLKDAFGITLEWTLDGDPSRLPAEIAVKIRKAA